jgi:hypothetical protein
MHKNATKYNETLSKWCKNKHGASKIMDTLETYQRVKPNNIQWLATLFNNWSGIDYKISSRKLVKISHLSNFVMLYDFVMVAPL